MSQMLLEIWPIVLSAAILFGLFRIRQHTAIEHWANWNLVFTGASIIGGAASLKLFAKLSELSSLLDTLTLYYFHILSFGSILLLIGLSQQIPLIARMVQVDGLLRQMLVELGSAPNHKSYDAVELASQVQSAIRQHQLLLADLQRSQATNEALIAAMPDMLFQISAEGIFLNNLTPQHTSHYTPTDQFIGMNIADFLEPALSETILNCIETVQTSQLMQRLQHEFTIGKLPRHLEARFLPNADGTAMAIVRDVTQEANLFQELSRSKKRYQTLLHHSNDAIIIHTPTGEFTDANQRAADLFGYPMDELMATGWENLLGENVQEMIAHARESLETDGYLAEEFVLQRKDGERLFGHISSTLIEVDDAPLVICIVRDVSQQKRDQFVLEAANIQLELARNQLEDRVAQRTDALQQANHDLEMLLYVVSHDLKEPLRAIENFSLLVNRRYASDLDMKGQDFLRRVVRASERMRKLIDD
ncbi:MAG: sensor histidine kinase, partial [Candidatus Promineifilaceae bacterium]